MTGIHGAESLPRRGMTLVEMLVATTITLIMMGLVAQLFGVFGQGVTGSRSVIELTDQMRAVGWRLRQDLSGATATMLPPRRPEADEGYFELLEGPATDTSTTSLASQNDTTALTGDCDDALLFTTRSPGAPFVGRFGTGTIESPVAEVAWFCRQATQQLTGGPTLFTLYRRQLLVMDYVGANPFQASGNVLPWSNPMPDSWDTYFLNYEISCSYVPTPAPKMTPNSLRDLTKRENRFSHNPTGVVSKEMYPYPVGSIPPLSGSRLGEDIVLNNVIAFDVRVFDPDAPVRLVASGGSVTPGDPGFPVGSGAEAMGAYVDLFWNRPLGTGPSSPQATFPPAGMTAFQSGGVFVCNPALPQGNLLLTTGSAVYDTWSTHYESNGIDENGNSFVDEGTNGLDDNANGLVDEPLEAETSAPYPVPLRGIEVRIRCYEPSSRQVRQISIRHTFVPF